MSFTQLGFDLPTDTELKEQKRLSALPDTEEEMIERVRELLEQYHHIMLEASDLDAKEPVLQKIDDISTKMNGGIRFGIAAPGGAYERLREALAAEDGKEPMHGQPGRFILETEGCRCLISTEGLFGVIASGFSCHAVDYDQPFISETGYRYFSGWTTQIKPGTFADRVRREVEAYQATQKLVHIGVSRKPDTDDPAWQAGGWLHKAAKTGLSIGLGG